MKNFILLLSLLLPLCALSQDEEYEAEKKRLSEEIANNNTWIADQTKYLKAAEQKVAESEATLKRLEDNRKNLSSNIARINSEIESALDDMSATQRMLGKKAAFYRCLRDSLSYRKYITVRECNLGRNIDFNASETRQLEAWNKTVGSTPGEITFQKEEAERHIRQSANQIDSSKKQLEHAHARKIILEDREARLTMKEGEIRLVDSHKNILNCDEGTPEVSLEEKVPFPGADFSGPFVGVPRDNQDGLGTCYANVAKNLLVSTSKGEDVASFLDLALVYKGTSGVIASGLEAGLSCNVLEKTAKQGFCPQEFTPFEKGEKNLLTESFLGNANSTVWDQAIIVKLLHKFLAGKDQFVRGNKELSDQMLGQAKFIIDSIKKNPHVKVPLPVVRNPIPSEWKILEFSAVAKRKDAAFNQENFMQDYKAEYKKFYPQYLKAVIDGKSQDAIFSNFLVTMKPFIDKYGMEGETKYWKQLFLSDTNKEFNDPYLKKQLTESLNFLKLITGFRNKSDTEFLDYCANAGGDALHFLGTLQPLLKHLTELKVDPVVLYNLDGKFREPTELMQLAIAPACLNRESRKTPKDGIICNDGYDTIRKLKESKKTAEQQKLELRRKVVASLVQGYALGNIFDRHINTIVGVRFNKQTKQCEYKIRESQTGTSGWQLESRIFNEIEGLTEVRRK